MVRKAFPGRRAEQGFTLAELLVSTAILVTVLAIAGTVLAAAVRTSKPQFRERYQRMQMAMNQLGEDLTFVNWGVWCGFASGAPCSTPVIQSSCPSGGSTEFTIPVYHPVLDSSTPPSGNAPGYLRAVPVLRVKYTLSSGGSHGTSSFSRDVSDAGGQIFVHQELVAQLNACEPGYPGAGSDDSYLDYGSASGVLSIVLRTQQQEAVGSGGSGTSEVRGTWYVR